MDLTRRQFVGQLAGLAGVVSLSSVAANEEGQETARTSELFRLGCQTLPYRGLPLSRALEGIRKAGYAHVMIYHTHENKPVFTPSLSSAARSSLRAQLKDTGLKPFMSFVGLMASPTTPQGLALYLQELDLCAEFGITTAVGIGPWYYDKFPTVPKRRHDWDIECNAFYAALESAVAHAESVGVTIALKPHTGITATAKECLNVVNRIVSERLKICWDAGNVSFYEGIHPDPDLPELAPHVKAVCIKDHLGGRAEANFPVPGAGQVNHDLMFRILCGAGFNGPIAVERVDGAQDAAKMAPEIIDDRIAAARQFLLPLLKR